ncbi:MAG: histidine phosphatase family protein [Microbacteriaceae bacterium]|nr:histidine phosphatase family protein [Microbacteriaceae bacterium]
MTFASASASASASAASSGSTSAASSGSPSVTIALTRHGQTQWNADGQLQGSTDIPLNDTGRSQAVESAARFDAAAWHGVATSPLSRAAETGSIIAEILGLPLVGVDHDLRERHYGDAEGMNEAQVSALWPNRDYTNMEERESVADRGLAALERLAITHSGRSIIVVAHGTLIREVLRRISSSDIPMIENAATSIVEFVNGEWRVITINNVALVA